MNWLGESFLTPFSIKTFGTFGMPLAFPVYRSQMTKSAAAQPIGFFAELSHSFLTAAWLKVVKGRALPIEH